MKGTTLNFTNILTELRSERNRINHAIAAIESLNSASGHRRTRPAASTAPERGGRRLTAAARRRLSQLMKQRWAQGKMGRRKKASAKAAQTSKSKRRISAAGRKRIAAAQRARWAKVKVQQRGERKPVAKAT